MNVAELQNQYKSEKDAEVRERLLMMIWFWKGEDNVRSRWPLELSSVESDVLEDQIREGEFKRIEDKAKIWQSSKTLNEQSEGHQTKTWVDRLLANQVRIWANNAKKRRWKGKWGRKGRV